MRRILVLPPLLAAVALTLAIGGCGGDASPSSPSSVDGFVSLATAGVHVDFEPLTSPKDAIDKGDLIVEGTLTEVTDGIRLQYANPAYTERNANSYITFVISVTRVIDGDAGQLSNGLAYVAVFKNAPATARELSAANPRPKIVAVLDDITSWTPSSDVTVVRPAAVPPGAPLYAPYQDGMWLQAYGDAEMRSLGAHREELAPAWGKPRHVDEFAAAIKRASGR